MKLHTTWILALAIAVSTSAGCSCCRQSTGDSPAATQPAAGAKEAIASERELATSQNSYVVVYATQPASIPLNEMFTVTVRVLDKATRTPVAKDIELQVDARMPHHRHGMNTQPQITRQSLGMYHVDGMQFHMPGRWELYFDVSADGRTERAQDVVILE